MVLCYYIYGGEEMGRKTKYEDYTKKALETLADIIEEAEDLKVKISAIKEILNITLPKSKSEEKFPEIIFKGDVDD